MHTVKTLIQLCGCAALLGRCAKRLISIWKGSHNTVLLPHIWDMSTSDDHFYNKERNDRSYTLVILPFWAMFPSHNIIKVNGHIWKILPSLLYFPALLIQFIKRYHLFPPPFSKSVAPHIRDHHLACPLLDTLEESLDKGILLYITPQPLYDTAVVVQRRNSVT